MYTQSCYLFFPFFFSPGEEFDPLLLILLTVSTLDPDPEAINSTPGSTASTEVWREIAYHVPLTLSYVLTICIILQYKWFSYQLM